MHQLDLWTLGLLLFVASLVAMITRRLNLPYSVGLVAAGICLAFLPYGIKIPLTPEMIFTIFLPPLIFEAAIQIPWRPFRRELPLLLLLVTIGLLLAAGVVTCGMHYLIGWSWLGSCFFGILISATDPVSVIAMFKNIDVEPRLRLLVEAESLLNDGVAAVGFAILVLIAAGEAATPSHIIWSLALTSAGGLAVGGGIAGLLLLIAGRTSDPLVEITLTTLAAFGSFLFAEHLHVSGVLAALTAGMVIGNFGWMGSFSDASRPLILSFWDYAAFLANSIIFILIGAQEASLSPAPLLAVSAAAIVLSLAGRAVTVYPAALMFRCASLRMAGAYQHVLWWGGLKGALALALALAIPASVAERDEIIGAAFAVVIFSIFVQGLSMEWLIGRLGLIRRSSDKA